MNYFAFETRDGGKTTFYFDEEQRLVRLHIVYPDYTAIVERNELTGAAYSEYCVEKKNNCIFNKRKTLNDALRLLERYSYAYEAKFLRDVLEEYDNEIYRMLED